MQEIAHEGPHAVVSCLSSGVFLPCLVVNAALSRHSYSHCLVLPGFMGVSLCQIVQLFGCSPSKCVRHWASSLVPDSRRSSSEPFLAQPSCCCCFPALSLPCPCFVTCGERWSASDRVWTFFHSRFPGVKQRGTLVSPCRAFCVRPPLVTCSTVCLSALLSRTFATVSVPSTQIPSLSGLATLGSSFPAPLSILSAQSAPMSRLLGRSVSVSCHCDTLIPLRGSSSSL